MPVKFDSSGMISIMRVDTPRSADNNAQYSGKYPFPINLPPPDLAKANSNSHTLRLTNPLPQKNLPLTVSLQSATTAFCFVS